MKSEIVAHNFVEVEIGFKVAKTNRDKTLVFNVLTWKCVLPKQTFCKKWQRIMHFHSISKTCCDCSACTFSHFLSLLSSLRAVKTLWEPSLRITLKGNFSDLLKTNFYLKTIFRKPFEKNNLVAPNGKLSYDVTLLTSSNLFSFKFWTTFYEGKKGMENVQTHI